jgi:hypothetical protein
MRRGSTNHAQQMFRADAFKATRGSNMALAPETWTTQTYLMLGGRNPR